MTDEQNSSPTPQHSEQTRGDPGAFQIGAFLAAGYMLLAFVLHLILAAVLDYSDDAQSGPWVIRLVLVSAAFIPATLVSSGTGLRGSARARRTLLLFLSFAGLPYLVGGAWIDFG